jgi:hypothetical protein
MFNTDFWSGQDIEGASRFGQGFGATSSKQVKPLRGSISAIRKTASMKAKR